MTILPGIIKCYRQADSAHVAQYLKHYPGIHYFHANKRFSFSQCPCSRKQKIAYVASKSSIECRNNDLSIYYAKYQNYAVHFFFAIFMACMAVYYPILKGSLILRAAKNEKSPDEQFKFSLRRYKRFTSFSTLEYKGVPYMTPNDFLRSVTQDEPPEGMIKRNLNDNDVKKILKNTPPLKDEQSFNFFRLLGTDGLISYTEYLFLLCILTKPEQGFKIAFDMFDTDGDQTVDKTEFLILEAVLGLRRRQKDMKLGHKVSPNQDNDAASRDVRDSPGLKKDVFDWVWHKSGGIIYNHPVQDTTLLVHLFGQEGNNKLTYSDFRKFMDDVQTEIFEVEFKEFSGGLAYMSEPDFARMLLRYAPLTNEDRKAYMIRIEKKKSDLNITFDQFRLFCRFLNALDDFTIAVKLYTFADLPVSQTEFARAIKITTGFTLDPPLIDVLFKIFDVDDNGRLSYSEFIHIMKERLHRGFRTKPTSTDFWPTFKRCIREEMKRY